MKIHIEFQHDGYMSNKSRRIEQWVIDTCNFIYIHTYILLFKRKMKREKNLRINDCLDWLKWVINWYSIKNMVSINSLICMSQLEQKKKKNQTLFPHISCFVAFQKFVFLFLLYTHFYSLSRFSKVNMQWRVLIVFYCLQFC